MAINLIVREIEVQMAAVGPPVVVLTCWADGVPMTAEDYNALMLADWRGLTIPLDPATWRAAAAIAELEKLG